MTFLKKRDEEEGGEKVGNGIFDQGYVHVARKEWERKFLHWMFLIRSLGMV